MCVQDDAIKWRNFQRYWPFVRGFHRWPVVPLTKASDPELWCFRWSASEQTVEQAIETPVIWGAIVLIMASLYWVLCQFNEWYMHYLCNCLTVYDMWCCCLCLLNLNSSPQCRIYASVNWVSICSVNGLPPTRRQAIIWTNAEILLIGPLGIKISEILIETLTFSFKTLRLKMSSAKWWAFCPGGDELSHEFNFICISGWFNSSLIGGNWFSCMQMIHSRDIMKRLGG